MKPGNKSHDSFASAIQFAEILIPSFIGLAYMVFSIGFRGEEVFFYGLFLLAIGAALSVLKGIEKVENLER